MQISITSTNFYLQEIHEDIERHLVELILFACLQQRMVYIDACYLIIKNKGIHDTEGGNGGPGLF